MIKTSQFGYTTLLIIIFTFGGKILGFIYDALIALNFGSGFETDAYFAALTANGVITALLWAAIHTTLIPLFAEVQSKEGFNKKIYFANNMIHILLIVTFIMMVIGWIFAPILIKVVAYGFEDTQYNLAVELTRIGFPKLLLTGCIGVLIAFLQSEQRFKSTSIIHIGSSLVFILYLIFFSKEFGIKGLMVTSILAVTIQLIILIPSSLKIGYKYQTIVNFKDEYFNKFRYLILPILLGTAINELNIVIDRTLASSLVLGSISSLNYASKLNNLVLGVFISAITTVIFPILSKKSSVEDIVGVKSIMQFGIKLILLITVPATVGLLVLAKPIVEIAFQRGEFDETATIMTSGALMCYSIGLISMALNLLVTRVYYSLHDTKTPMKIGAVTVLLNIVLNLILIRYLDHLGLALATSIATSIGAIIMLYGLRKKLGSIGTKLYLVYTMKLGISSAIMGIVVILVYQGLDIYFNDSFLSNLILLLLSIGVAVIIYCGICYILKVDEVKILTIKVIRIIEKSR